MDRKRRVLCSALVLTVALVFLFSVGFIAVRSDHACCGDHCAVCSLLTLCKRTLSVFVHVAPDVCFAAMLRSALLHFPHSALSRSVHTTPVSLKVKLSN